MIRDKLPHFDRFCAYFHQDWDLEDNTCADVISRFCRENHPSLTNNVIEEITQLLELELPDSELSYILAYDLGCYYNPEFQSMSTQAWLLWVKTFLHNQIAQLSAVA